MRAHVIRWYGNPVEFRLRRIALRGQQPLALERKDGHDWRHIARVASEREAERIVVQLGGGEHATRH